MITEKTQTAPRLVVNGSIRFCGRTFLHPLLEPLSGTTVYVAYDHLTDTTVDVLNANMDVVTTLINRVVAA